MAQVRVTVTQHMFPLANKQINNKQTLPVETLLSNSQKLFRGLSGHSAPTSEAARSRSAPAARPNPGLRDLPSLGSWMRVRI